MMKNTLLIIAVTLFCFFLAAPSFAQNKVSFGISSEYSANYMKKSAYLAIDYRNCNYMKLGLSGLYEPFKKNIIGLKTTLSYKRYAFYEDYTSSSLWSFDKLKRSLSYLEFNAALLVHFTNPKHGLIIDYSIEKYLSQNYEKSITISWNHYEDIHQAFGLGFYYFPISDLQFTIKGHGSLKPFGVHNINAGEFIRNDQKFLVYGAGLSISYYFNRKKKAKNQE